MRVSKTWLASKGQVSHNPFILADQVGPAHDAICSRIGLVLHVNRRQSFTE